MADVPDHDAAGAGESQAAVAGIEHEQDYTIVSAGEDGEFGTPDDLRRTREQHLAGERR